MKQDAGLRHRAAFCHLATFAILPSIWLPLLLRRSDPDEDFLYYHSTGAAWYQALGLGTMVVLWLCRTLPYRWMSEASAGFLLAFLGVIALCLVGMYFMGALALAFQAWNGDPFWAPLVSWIIGNSDGPSEE
jgi:hypothetical protein